MIDAVKPLAAKAKLALSRAELLAAMGYEEMKTAADGVLNLVEIPKSQDGPTVSALGAKVKQSGVGRWWHRHPLRSVLQLGRPFLDNYAEQHPGKLIAYGAGTGALLWILKPWKLLSVATVVTLIFRSSDISGMISDVVKKASGTSEDHFPPLSGSQRPQPDPRPKPRRLLQ